MRLPIKKSKIWEPGGKSAASQAWALPAVGNLQYIRKVLNGTQVQAQTKASAPAFSVSKSNYLALLSVALDQLQGSLVSGNTLAAFVEPMLRAMAAKAEWKDAAGKAGGGDFVEYKLPWDPKRKLKLKLILDDQDQPPLAGLFHSTGSDTATLSLFIRNNGSVDDLASSAYHESLHLLTWVGENTKAKKPMSEAMGLNTGQGEAWANLDTQQHAPMLKIVRRRLGRIADTVNAARSAGNKIPDSKIDAAANWLVQEYLIRVESEVYKLFASQEKENKVQKGLARMTIGPSPELFFKASDVLLYLFEVSGVFKAEDKAALTQMDYEDIAAVSKIFGNAVEGLVKRRFSAMAFGTQGEPSVEILEMPKRSFVDKIQPAD